MRVFQTIVQYSDSYPPTSYPQSINRNDVQIEFRKVFVGSCVLLESQGKGAGLLG